MKDSMKGNKVVTCIFSKFLGSAMSGGIYVENNVDFGNQENYRDVDFFMRLKTGIKNGGGRGPPTFYTDQVSTVCPLLKVYIPHRLGAAHK